VVAATEGFLLAIYGHPLSFALQPALAAFLFSSMS
jgi:hypothetical protein